MFKKLNFSKKLLLGIISVLLLTSAISSYFIVNKSFSGTERIAKENIKNLAIANALQSKQEIENGVIVSYGFAQALKTMYENKHYSKKSIIDLMKQILNTNSNILGVFTDLEAGVFFEDDMILANKQGHNKNGKFVPYIAKVNDEIVIDSSTSDSDEFAFWIETLKRTKHEHITEPYFFPIKGKDILMISIGVPVFSNNKYLGIIGVDISLDEIAHNVGKTKILNTGYGFLISEDGTVIAHPKKEIIGKKLKDVTKEKNNLMLSSKIKENKEFFYNVISLGNKKMSFSYIYPFELAQSNIRWGFGISVPEEEYLEDAITIKWFSIIAGLISFLIIALVVLFNTRILNKNLDAISQGLSSFFKYLNKETSSSEKIELNSEDEFGKMAKEINENVQKIEVGLSKDNSCVKEVLKITQRVENGYLDSRIDLKANNLELIKLSESFNAMLNSLEKRVGKDLNNISTVLKSFSQYDFTAKVKSSKGEIENSINHLGLEISNLLKESMSVGLTLQSVSNKLLNNVDILNTNSNQTAASLEETAAALEEIASTIVNNTQNVSKMTKFATTLSSSAKKGQELAYNTTSAMDDITGQVTLINEAISVIDQIAFQTNILSLNAAVEAATAGEAGKGFAVVAQEVRNLASRSAEAAKEIKELVENATVKTAQGKAIGSDMIKGYEELSQNIKASTQMIEEISQASKEQQTGITQINDSIASLDSQTQENANIANQTQSIANQANSVAK